MVMGAITASYSTAVVVLGSGRLGRDVDLSWMEVGMVLLGNESVSSEPNARHVVAGLFVHIFADFTWAMIFFGLLAAGTRRLTPRRLLVVAGPWALGTAAVEYYLILPWLQPWLRMQSPFWINVLVHVASASAYTIAFWLSAPLLDDRRYVRFSQRAAAAVAGGIAVLGVLAVLGGVRQEPPLPWTGDPEGSIDAGFLRDMTRHHEAGVVLAELAAARSPNPDVRALGRLMAAEQRTEADAMRRWWHGFYGQEMPASGGGTNHVPGLPTATELNEVRVVDAARFDTLFTNVMGRHHLGAIQMADEALRRAGDQRIKLLASQIGHAQAAQHREMHRLVQDAAGGTKPVHP